jgi:hypothetical protein
MVAGGVPGDDGAAGEHPETTIAAIRAARSILESIVDVTI